MSVLPRTVLWLATALLSASAQVEKPAALAPPKPGVVGEQNASRPLGQNVQSGAVPASTLPGRNAAGVAEPSTAASISSPANPATETEDDDTPVPAVASQVRIVRLSQVRGKAQIERSPGAGLTAAFANIPVVSGARLRTQEGVAEVEFEDGSTLRLTTNSAVDFVQLGRTASGATVSEVSVVGGSVYVSLARGKDATFQLTSGKAVLRLSPGAHIRLDISGTNLAADTAARPPSDSPSGITLAQALASVRSTEPNASLTVFDGEVDFSSPSGHSAVSRKHTLNFDTTGSVSPVLEAHIEKAPFDAWDKEGIQYQKRYAGNAFSGSGSLYGASDLNYYGSFADLPGCGSVWRPYFTSAAWDPYGNGIWAWYGNAGYSWVSPYPWGWLPFHTGSWQMCGGSGWGWRPGGAFYGLGNRPRLFRPTVYGVIHPPRPPRPPAPGNPRLVAVNVRPLAPSGLSAPQTFLFRKDSAGLGIPREGFHHLGHESSLVERKGASHTEVDLQRFILPQSNHTPDGMYAGAWHHREPGAGGSDRPSSSDRAAWAAAHGSDRAGSRPVGPSSAGANANVSSESAMRGALRENRSRAEASGRAGTPSPGTQGGPQRSYGEGRSGASAPAYRSAPSSPGPSAPQPSFRSAPMPTSAPASSSAPAAGPRGGGGHGK